MPPIKPNSYAWTSPYQSSWPCHFYGLHFENLYGRKMVHEKDLREQILTQPFLPEIMFMGNFVVDRSAIASICKELGINLVYGEDGFFPHYTTMHLDPLGFCWESSLCRMVFRNCSDRHRRLARRERNRWLNRSYSELPLTVKKPYVLWPLQLLGDKVNRWDLNLRSWNGIITHFRKCLPVQYQLVLKPHPRASADSENNLDGLIKELPNTVLLPKKSDLQSLVRNANAVAGANSSVLYEARLMFGKPVYSYARGWYTNHDELFIPMQRNLIRELPRAELIDDGSLLHTERLDEYTDWFLAQLLSRQVRREFAQRDAKAYQKRVFSLSLKSFIEYGEDIFQRTRWR